MADRIVVDEVRYAYRRVSIEAAELIPFDGYSIGESTENRPLFETVSQAIQNDLTDDQKHVIILRFLEGFSLNDTASILGIKVGTVKVAQRDCRKTPGSKNVHKNLPQQA